MRSQNNIYKKYLKSSEIKYIGYVFSETLQEQQKCEDSMKPFFLQQQIRVKIKNKILSWSVACINHGRLRVQNTIRKQQKSKIECKV